MALVETKSGCKVGWSTYTTEAEALAASKEAADERERKLARGYDFGYLWPGTITHVENHPEHGEVWIVTIP